MYLSPAGLSVTGPGQRVWAWEEITDIQVLDVPVRSAAVRWATRVTTVVAAALDAWVPGSPARMTVVVHTRDERVGTPVLSAAAVAYTQREVDLSLGLLAHFVRGSASPSTLTQWWTENRPDELLRSRHRERALESRLAPLL
ncbi:hypothetical protein [Streptomyces sp. NBC_00388]|uniref:hypothetical protein n=1 Tax=Streptomyces sp. NBC_00388 TaxID=2975735 RepID=UPI002E22C27C